MWKDFDLFSPKLPFRSVNDRIPILRLFSLDKALILNIFTNAKLLLPMSNDSNRVNRLISKNSNSISLHVHGSRTMDVAVDSIEGNESMLYTFGNNEEQTSIIYKNINGQRILLILCDTTFVNEDGSQTFLQFGISKSYQDPMIPNTFQFKICSIIKAHSVCLER